MFLAVSKALNVRSVNRGETVAKLRLDVSVQAILSARESLPKILDAIRFKPIRAFPSTQEVAREKRPNCEIDSRLKWTPTQ